MNPLASSPRSINGLTIKEGLDDLTPARIVTLFRRAPLLREANRRADVWKAYENSPLVLSAWLDGQLVGLARVLTDGEIFSYLCDLAVEPDVQRIGVGTALIDAIVERCAGTELILQDSELSAGFYSHLGFKRVTNSWALTCR